ncbi:hypothetical protein Pmani_020841 [Petrolisthes manimaculis]|uniref:Uncharacterized protein n=1 Tax=Petrolisthes manimaculis TaxID=1843537 RepID=A0AAE1U5W2_9EUCA|nr:hypothetical protein Pmani_020841 [Petrolisthes manimaculis]
MRFVLWWCVVVVVTGAEASWGRPPSSSSTSTSSGDKTRARYGLRQVASDCSSPSCCGYTEGSAGCRFQGNRCRCPFIIVPTRLSPFSEIHHRRPSKPVVRPPNYVYGRPLEAAASSSPSSGTSSQVDDGTRTHRRRHPTSGLAPNYVYGRPPSSDPSDHDHSKNMTNDDDDDEAPEFRRTVVGDDHDHQQKAPKRDDYGSDDRQTTRGDGDGEWSQGDD